MCAAHTASHITQRGVDRTDTFSCVQDHATYLRLLRDNLSDARVASSASA